jgi:hypothetical protein
MDNYLQDIVSSFGPQMVSMFFGLITGVGVTGAAFGIAVLRKRHDSRELRPIVIWLAMNMVFLAIGAAFLIWLEVRATQAPVLKEAADFARELFNSQRVALVSLVTGVVAAMLAAFSGYISHTRQNQHRVHPAHFEN